MSPGDDDELATPVAEDTVDDTHVELVRASSRIQIDFQAIPADKIRDVRVMLLETRRRAVTGANVVLRQLQRLDEDALDKFLIEEKRLPRTGKEWPFPQIKNRGYNLVHESVPELGTACCLAMANMALRRWQTDRWNALVRQTERPPRFAMTLPIEIHTQGVKLRPAGLDPNGKPAGRWVLDVAFTTGRGNRITLPLMVKDEFQENILSKCWHGTWKMGQPKIQQDSKRPGKWYVRFPYKRLVPKLSGGKHAAIHRGIRCAVAAVIDGVEDPWIYDGYGIEAYLKQIQRRRREYQYDSKGSGRDGRGRKHILRPIKPLEQKAERWRQNKNQTIARRLARWLHDRGVTSYTVEDFTGIRRGEPERVGVHVWERVQEWPYYDLGMRLQSCLQELGIVDRCEVDATFISQRCPRCGHIDPANVDMAKWQMKCTSCRFRKHLDASAAMNVSQRGAAKRAGNETLYAELCGHDIFKPGPPRGQKKKRGAKKKTTEPPATEQ